MSKQKQKKESKQNNKQSQVNEEQLPILMDKHNNILIKIIAKPGAKRSALTDISSDGVGVQINAPATEGEANIELLRYVSDILGVRKNDLTLERGFKSRQKTLKLSGSLLTKDQVEDKIRKELQD